jgi:hypothetical protein
MLTKTFNTKNLKNTYKILMTTFSKAYDSLHKNIPIKNLINPLYESIALVYGALKSS